MTPPPPPPQAPPFTAHEGLMAKLAVKHTWILFHCGPYTEHFSSIVFSGASGQDLNTSRLRTEAVACMQLMYGCPAIIRIHVLWMDTSEGWIIACA